MSENHTNHILALPNKGVDVSSIAQYGMRFPDGSVNWEAEYATSSGQKIKWGRLADRDRHHVYQWNQHLAKQASAAHIDATDYINGHQLIKRTVIVSVTGAEDVSTGPGVDDDLIIGFDVEVPVPKAPWS